MLNFPTLISLISRIFYSFGVFTERQNENPRCLQRRKIREIREIRVSPSKKYSRNRLAFSKESRIFAGRYKIIGDRNYD